MENNEAYQKAKKRVETKVGFYIHLAIYISVSVLLAIINLSTTPHLLWFKWPLIGWGIGVCFHGLGAFVFSEGSVIKEQMIENEIKKEESRNRE